MFFFPLERPCLPSVLCLQLQWSFQDVVTLIATRSLKGLYCSFNLITQLILEIELNLIACCCCCFLVKKFR